jgi:hypothetical protein
MCFKLFELLCIVLFVSVIVGLISLLGFVLIKIPYFLMLIINVLSIIILVVMFFYGGIALSCRIDRIYNRKIKD